MGLWQSFPASRSFSRGGFTLIELLVSIGIIAILAGLSAMGVLSVRESGRKVKEIGAARNLITAYVNTPMDNDGRYLAGYDRTTSEVQWPNGTSVHGPAANRYPYRLAAYLNYQLKGTILVNENERQVNQADSYSVSLSPAFGFNYLFVGGDVSAAGQTTNDHECITRSNQSAPVLAFASAAFSTGGSTIRGFNILTPPSIYGPMWKASPWNKGSNPGDYGNVDPRHSGKAVCAFLDGSVRLLGIDDLRDMTLWSRNARADNNPNYVVSTAAAAAGPRRR